MASIRDINRELKERLRSADGSGHGDDWLQRLATHPHRRMAGKRRLHVQQNDATDPAGRNR